MKANKLIFLSTISVFLLIAVVSAQASTTSYESCKLTVNILNQDPYPAVPGEYVKVVFQVSGLDDPNCKGAKFRLVPKYPFSLDTEDEVKVLDGNTYIASYEKAWNLGYKLRVDESAIGGENDIEIRYSTGAGSTESYIKKTLNITVEDTRTYFDAVVQDFSDNQISIALANVGEKTANAAVARIPSQEGYRILGTDGQMIGNLESGDYTIVSFEIAPKQRGSSEDVPLEFQIDYTDSIGERRSVLMNLTLNMNSYANTNMTLTGPGTRFAATQKQSGISTTTWIIIIAVVLIILFILYKNRGKILGLLKKSPKNSRTNEPEWMKGHK